MKKNENFAKIVPKIGMSPVLGIAKEGNGISSIHSKFQGHTSKNLFKNGDFEY